MGDPSPNAGTLWKLGQNSPPRPGDSLDGPACGIIVRTLSSILSAISLSAASLDLAPNPEEMADVAPKFDDDLLAQAADGLADGYEGDNERGFGVGA